MEDRPAKAPGAIHCTALTYDKVSQRSTMNVPDVGRVTYTHDPGRQLTKLKNGHNEVTTLAYDDAGRKTESKLSNGTRTSFTYDAANQKKGVVNVNSTNTTLSYYNYQFDGVGDRTSLWDNGVDVSNWNYDFTGQLTNDVYRPATTALNWNGLTVDQWFLLDEDGWDNLLADHVPTGGARLLAYSPAGNRLTQTDPVTGDVTTFTYDNGNRLLAGVDVSGTTTYTYDDNGNQLTIEEPSGDITTNTWDGENRLIQVEHPSGDLTTYAYNGDGLRVLQDDGVAETRFVYDGNNLVLELDDVGVVNAEASPSKLSNNDALTFSSRVRILCSFDQSLQIRQLGDRLDRHFLELFNKSEVDNCTFLATLREHGVSPALVELASLNFGPIRGF